MNELVRRFNNSDLSINLTSILILNNETNEFEPWFIAKEVATLLGYTNVSKAIGDHVDELDQRMLSRREYEVLFGQNITDSETVENIDDLIVDLEKIEEEEDDRPKIAIVGKPNAGKSSLINNLLGENRVIVSDVAGTTRDAIDTEIVYNGTEYVFIDTAGLRRKNKIKEEIEKY